MAEISNKIKSHLILINVTLHEKYNNYICNKCCGQISTRQTLLVIKEQTDSDTIIVDGFLLPNFICGSVMQQNSRKTIHD